MEDEPSTSDLQICVSAIKHRKDLIGYRNLLSYTSSLGIRVIPPLSLAPESWDPIGTGTYSSTWRAALDAGSGPVVAVKQPNASFTRSKAEVGDQVQHEALSSMIQELRILAHPKLKSHPNLPHILGVFFQEEENPPGIRPCLIFDLAVSNLHEYLSRHKPSGREMMILCSHIASGICALHAYGLVHGDIKPANVFLFLRDGELVATVGDLGTCGVASQTCGVIPGTEDFWAPECHTKSPFHSYVNRPFRDVYSFGLVVFSVLTCCKERPFPPQSQFAIQHNDAASLEFLFKRIPADLDVPDLCDVIRESVKAEPEQRARILGLCQELDAALGKHRQFEEIQELAETTLLTDPESPRVNVLGQMSLPESLMSKLLSEFTLASDDTHSVRLALTMAAFYSGALGPGIAHPWDVVAKAQWLLKAVELGSYAAVSSVMADLNVLRVLEEFGDKILAIHQPIFASPSIALLTLLSRLRGFAAMPDVESLNILVFLGGDIPNETEREVARLTAGKNEQQQRVRMAIPNMSQLEVFIPNRDADLQTMGSDAYDLTLSNASDIVRTVYNNNLEGFIPLAEGFELEPGDSDLQYFMALAIFNGSLDVVRYLLDQYHVSTDDSWEGMTHFNHSVFYRQQAIVEIFLERNATVRPASGNELSALHLVSRHDDEQLVRLLCEHLKDHGNLTAILESTTSEGPLSNFTAVYVAMISLAWKNAQTLLEYGADPNAGEDGSRLIDFAVRPMSPAAPISILQTLLEMGAAMDRPADLGPPPLQMAIQSSNVLAVLHLLLQGASVSFPNSPDFIEEAQSSVTEMQTDERLEVLNEDGLACPQGWDQALEASILIHEMIYTASKKEGDWRGRLQELVRGSSDGCRGKMWIVDKIPPTMMVEIRVPPNW